MLQMDRCLIMFIDFYKWMWIESTLGVLILQRRKAELKFLQLFSILLFMFWCYIKISTKRIDRGFINLLDVRTDQISLSKKKERKPTYKWMELILENWIESQVWKLAVCPAAGERNNKEETKPADTEAAALPCAAPALRSCAWRGCWSGAAFGRWRAAAPSRPPRTGQWWPRTGRGGSSPSTKTESGVRGRRWMEQDVHA